MGTTSTRIVRSEACIACRNCTNYRERIAQSLMHLPKSQLGPFARVRCVHTRILLGSQSSSPCGHASHGGKISETAAQNNGCVPGQGPLYRTFKESRIHSAEWDQCSKHNSVTTYLHPHRNMPSDMARLQETVAKEDSSTIYRCEDCSEQRCTPC